MLREGLPDVLSRDWCDHMCLLDSNPAAMGRVFFVLFLSFNFNSS